MMTCARVRGFRERAPPEVTLEPKIIGTSRITLLALLIWAQFWFWGRWDNYIAFVAEKPSQLTAFDEKEARKQIEIRSGCQWRKDHKKVLEELCRRMNQNNIPENFVIEPYQIRLITKIIMQKPSGSVIKYRVRLEILPNRFYNLNCIKMSLSSLSSCILVNHQPMMGKSLKAVTKKSMPLMVRTWKQLRKSQLCTMESLLFWVVCYLLANSEPEPNQLAAKHLDLYRLGYSIFDTIFHLMGKLTDEAWMSLPEH